MAENRARKVLAIVNSGSTEYGAVVRFDFKFADGSVEAFHAAYESMAKIIQMLIQSSAIAGRVRKGTAAPSKIDTLSMWNATAVRAGVSMEQSIVVQFQTTQGIPVALSMPRTLAETMLDRVRDAIDQKPPAMA